MRKHINETKWESYYFNQVVLQILEVAPLRDRSRFRPQQGTVGVKAGGAFGEPMEVTGGILTFTVILN